jgi:sugar lactone lactonase YvrE
MARVATVVFAAIVSGCTGTATTQPAAPAYSVETLVAGSPLHGAKGIRFGPDGGLYVCSIVAQSIFRVNVATGAVTTAVGAPHGECDDVAFAPDGTMAWTAMPSAEIRAQRPGGRPHVVASNLPLVNPLGYTAEGRLYAAQIGIDRFLEIDVTGEQPPRLIARGIGHLNSFDIDADRQLYGPLAGLEKIARIDLASGDITIISEGLGVLSSVKLDSKGQLYAVGWASGNLFRVDADTGATEIITVLDPPLDNLAIGADDMLYVSQPARSAIVKVDPVSGEQTPVVAGKLGVPGGLALTTVDGKETLIVADDFAVRHVDTQTGEVWATVDLAEFMDPANATDVAATQEVVVLSDVKQSRVYMLDRATGETLHKWKRIDTPYGLVLTDTGDVIVAAFDAGQLIRLSTTDRKAREVITDGLLGPVGVSPAGPDALYITEALAGTLSRVTISTGEKAVIATGLDQPEGLAVLANGHVVVVEAGAGQVTEIDPATGATTVLVGALPIGAVVPETPGPVHVPTGIAAGNDGVLYLSSDVDRSVLKLVPL